MAFSAQIRHYRCISNRIAAFQTELGKLAELDLHYSHSGRFGRGTSRPSGDTLLRLAHTLGVSRRRQNGHQNALGLYLDQETITNHDALDKRSNRRTLCH